MEEARQTRSLLNRITKRHAAFITHVMRREGFRTPYHYGKTGRKTRQREQGEQKRTDTLSARMDREEAMSVISATKN